MKTTSVELLELLSSHGRIVIDSYKDIDGKKVYSLDIQDPSVRISGESSLEFCLQKFKEYLRLDE